MPLTNLHDKEHATFEDNSSEYHYHFYI